MKFAIILTILAVFVLFSGCIGNVQDLEKTLLANSAISSFKAAHPNAQFSAVLWNDSDLQVNVDKVMNICGKTLMGEYYYFNMTENKDIIEGFVNKDTYDLVCVKNYQINDDVKPLINEDVNTVPQTNEIVDTETSDNETQVVVADTKITLCVGEKVSQNEHGFKFDKVYTKEKGDYARIYDLESNGYMDILLNSGRYNACEDVKTFDYVVITFEGFNSTTNCGVFTFNVSKKGCLKTNFNCKETDKGQDYYTAGITTGRFFNAGVTATGETYPEKGARSFKDSCTLIVAGGETDKSKSIKEFFCNDDGLVGLYYSECPNNGTCINGACTKAALATDCKETDKGKDYYTAGATTGYYYNAGVDAAGNTYPEKEVKTFKDSCTLIVAGGETDKSKSIKEFFCNDGLVGMYYSECPNNGTCINGACTKVDLETNFSATIKVEGRNDRGIFPDGVKISLITQEGKILDTKTMSNKKAEFTVTNNTPPFIIRTENGAIAPMNPDEGYGVPANYGWRYHKLIKVNNELFLQRIDDGAQMKISYPYILYVINNNANADSTICTDNDLNDIFTKGTVTGLNYSGNEQIIVHDGCTLTDGGAETSSGKYVVENVCNSENKAHANYYECPNNGMCVDGACTKIALEKLATTIQVQGGYNSSLSESVPSNSEVCIITDKEVIIECKNLINNKTSFNITNDYNFVVKSKDSKINSNLFAITGFGNPKKYGDRYETLVKKDGKLYLLRIDDGASMDLSVYNLVYVYKVS